MPRPKSQTPGYSLHKRSGRAYVTIDGKQHYLPGQHGSPESRAAYDRIIGEWLSSGRTLIDKTSAEAAAGPTVSMIVAAFVRHAESFYVHPDGTQTSEFANIKAALGSLEAVSRIVFVTGFVNAVDGFAESPAVINGASDLFVKVFGEAGRHARAAVAVNGLPRGATAEIQVVVEVR